MKSNSYEIIVIGGGPAGMMAAGRAGQLGAKVLLIEKNNRLGKKLSMTGGGRCNITNAEFDRHLFLSNFPESKQFLFSPFSQFDVQDTFDFFENLGLPLMVEERNRAFPESESAEDVCDAMAKYMKKNKNVTIKLETALENFIIKDGVLTGAETSSGEYFAKKIIVATGGFAAPKTGSTGECFKLLGGIGHTIKSSDPNLVPLKTSTKWIHELSGTSLDDIGLRFIQNEKPIIKKSGRILFTHFGISGPMVINSAHQVKTFLQKSTVDASIDIFPEYDIAGLDKYIIERIEENKNILFKKLFKDTIPAKLLQMIFKINDLQIGDIPAHSVTKQQRKIFVQAVKDIRFPITGTMGLDWSIVADGGVDPQEINFKYMNSKLHENLYLIGDTIHINRPSGGFSLQLCWTTGWVAGTHSASK
ncbi:aminoacetone oxidase family FAD-binding enzyme [Patescibacteria group bacterium]|nr:aminoacetone oxidase family FAD-binding enzyme [Patescibacteria group bacterium]